MGESSWKQFSGMEEQIQNPTLVGMIENKGGEFAKCFDTMNKVSEHWRGELLSNVLRDQHVEMYR